MWKTMEYAVIGRSHESAGIPCQDRVRTYHTDNVTVITLADGAGSSRLSHLGAEAVLEQVSCELGEHFVRYFEEKNAAVVRKRLLDVILDALEAVMESEHCGLKDLSSTLLAVAVSGQRYLAVHIGDGVIGYLKDGKLKTATRPDNGEFVNETVFTTSSEALTRMRLFKGEGDGIGGFVLMSDGTEAALYDKRRGRISAGVTRVLQMMVMCPENVLRAKFAGEFCAVIPTVTTDDCSISLMSDTDTLMCFQEYPDDEKMDFLQIDPEKPNSRKRLGQTEKLLRMARDGIRVERAARELGVSLKAARNKLSRLTDLGFLEVTNGCYRSC